MQLLSKTGMYYDILAIQYAIYNMTGVNFAWNAKLTYIPIFKPIFKYLNLGTNNCT